MRIEIPIETIDETEAGVKKAKRNLDDLEKSISKIKAGMDQAQKSTTKFDESFDKTNRTLRQWMKEKYEVLLEAKDKVSPILKTLGSGIKSVFGKGWSVTLKAVDMVTAPVRGIINLLKNPILQAGAVLGVSFGVKDTVDTYADFEATMSRVQALSNASSTELEQLTQKAKSMGATTKFSGTESAEAFTYMAQAGWGVQDMLDGISGVMSLAASDGLDLASTTDIVSNALTAFGLKAKDTARFADVLAVASSASNTDVSGLGEAFKYVAPVAGAMKYSIEDVSLALGIMSNNAVKGSMAGTSLKTALANMSAPTEQMAAAMDKYGISLTDSQGNMKTMKGVLDNLRQGLGGLSEVEQTAAASTIFGKEAMAGMLAIINASEEDYESLAKQIENSSGAADRMAETMQDNLAGTLEELGGAAETLKLTLGERLQPYIESLANWLINAMPDIEIAVSHAMDYIDSKVESMKAKIDEFTSSDAWKNADFFGKIEIAWDELVAQPFSEWWSSGGREKVIGNAASLGRNVGSAVSGGLLALFGIETSGVLDEGMSVGSAFAKGLIAGFDVDAVQEALWSAMKGIFSNAAEILPGGKEADLSSWLSAALIAKIASPLISIGGKGISFGKNLWTGGTSGMGLKKLLGSFSLSGGTASGSGLAGILGKVGMGLGSTATTGTGMVLSGAGAVGGGIMAGTTLISAVDDLNTAFTTDDKDKAAAYGKSAAWKGGGTLAGAAIGTAILPGVGTLIGAGIGALGGWLMGENEKKKYEESLQKAQEDVYKLKLAEEQAKYESQELKDALADTSMTGEEFAQMLQQAASDKIRKSFGDIKLSLEEIQGVAQKLVFANEADAVVKYSEAVDAAASSYANLSDTVSAMDKLNWKASIGIMTDEDIETYKAGIDQLVADAQSYIEDKHYQATVAMELILGEDANTEGINTLYGNLQNQISDLSTQLSDKLQIVLEDGVITLDEQAELSSLQNQITEITNSLNSAETEATFSTLKIKYTGADLDADSFANLQTEIQGEVEALTQQYDEALKLSITNLNLQLDQGIINEDEYNAQLQALTEGYQGKIDELQVRVESFQLDAIAEAFSADLDGILPEIEGTTAEKLSTALNNAMAQGWNGTIGDTASGGTWTAEMVASALGLDSLQMEAQTAITSMMSQVAQTLPAAMSEGLSGVDMSAVQSAFDSSMYTLTETDFSWMSEALSSNMASSLSAGDYSAAGNAVTTGAGNAINSASRDPIFSSINTLYSDTGSQINSVFATPFSTTADVNVTLNWKLLNPTANINVNGGGSTSVTANIGSVGKKANGGFVSGRQLSWIGEEGPEAIIPLVPSRRDRAMDLFWQTGRALGVLQNAEGGVYGTDTSTGNIPVTVDGNGQGQMHKVDVNVSVAPTINVSGQDSADADKIRSSISELADDFCEEIAIRLTSVMSNMPVSEGA